MNQQTEKPRKMPQEVDQGKMHTKVDVKVSRSTVSAPAQAPAQAPVSAPSSKPSSKMTAIITSDQFFSKVRHNHIDIVQAAIDQGFDVNSRDDRGNTGLIISCQNNLKKMASILIDSGECDVNIVNKQGKTALDYCDILKYRDLAYYLVLQGAENAELDAMEDFPSVNGQFLSTADIKSFR